METTAARKDLNVRFRLNRGDLLFRNNFTTLHRRTAYEDYEDEELRRTSFVYGYLYQIADLSTRI